MKIEIINGPNLNLLGKREPDIYGREGFEAVISILRSRYPQVTFTVSQSNVEGELVSMVQAAATHADGVIINPGGYTHTSVALADAIAAISIPVIEVHISNLLSREEFRHTSLTGRYCRGSIMGLGTDGYRLAADALIELMK
ncbi:MAG: type II 3-dehydroquinate dehydratase [Bacteroidales bacterium]|jgi:3-dehydroquinate dehydratase-2|nr:type II 3-dehydroquinate dehydratase [Bacteroidales bacterium]MCB9027792.1 type II 3-dehydroquinate dehydratase [Bacteroidales bacterium]MDD3735856.1 type II 3-dehydroquinate dehydratase [Bacteroidales bacterium]NLD63724.1 type II 3-dehydroquinate dehydratase [Bacteroidales bacterium]HNT93722.1 type II 3-dehydroquinate dehydratase [Bacteroidales bacterium]